MWDNSVMTKLNYTQWRPKMSKLSNMLVNLELNFWPQISASFTNYQASAFPIKIKNCCLALFFCLLGSSPNNLGRTDQVQSGWSVSQAELLLIPAPSCFMKNIKLATKHLRKVLWLMCLDLSFVWRGQRPNKGHMEKVERHIYIIYMNT